MRSLCWWFASTARLCFQRCPPFLHFDSLRCMRARCLLALRRRPTRSPLDNASLSDTPMSMPTAASLPGNTASSTSYVRLTKSLRAAQRYGQGLQDAFRQSQSLAKPYLRQAFDADGAIITAWPEHRDIYIGKLDGVPAPPGLEARIARRLSAAHPAIERPPRPVSAAQNAAANLNGHATPEGVTGAYRCEFSVLAIQRHTLARPVRPAPLFERRIIQLRAFTQDFRYPRIARLAGVRSMLVCPVKGCHAGILSERGFLCVLMTTHPASIVDTELPSPLYESDL